MSNVMTTEGGEANGQPVGVLTVQNYPTETHGVNRPTDRIYGYFDGNRYETTVECIRNAAATITSKQYAYHCLFGPNSNSAAKDITVGCGIPVTLSPQAPAENVPLLPSWHD
jgi:hypothetical protein